MRTLFASRIVALAAKLETTELGVRTIKTGKMTGQVVRWGKHLPTKMPAGFTGNVEGTMHISDPATKASMVVQRGIDKLASNTTRWQGGRRAYIANINVPKAHRNTIAGGKAIHKMTKGVFDHLDKRGVSATTIAGAYEKRSSEARIAGTHALVQGYQKRGFRIDSRVPTVPNEWNVTMTRSPSAKAVKPVSRNKFEGQMEKQRAGHIENAKAVLKEHLSPLIPGARTVAGAAAIGGAGVVAGTKNKHQDTGKKVLSPALAAGGVIAAIKGKKVVDHLRKNAGEIGDYSAVLANVGRVGPGKSLARSRGLRGFVGKSMLHGLL